MKRAAAQRRQPPGTRVKRVHVGPGTRNGRPTSAHWRYISTAAKSAASRSASTKTSAGTKTAAGGGGLVFVVLFVLWVLSQNPPPT